VTITIWRVEFCHSSIGVYDYQWFATEKEAKKYIKKLVKEDDFQLVDESEGEDGTVLDTPEPIEIDLTTEGLLSFANNYAVDTGAC
jgi:hypothetical protein